MPTAPKPLKRRRPGTPLREIQRGTAHQRGYDTRWQKARIGFLAKHPLCRSCQDAGRVEPATVVDHIVPHKGDRSMFWDADNWQPLCKRCHDIKTATEDRGAWHWRDGK